MRRTMCLPSYIKRSLKAAEPRAVRQAAVRTAQAARPAAGRSSSQAARLGKVTELSFENDSVEEIRIWDSPYLENMAREQKWRKENGYYIYRKEGQGIE